MSAGASAGGLQPKSCSVHAVSQTYVPSGSVALRVVPPTPVTFGSDAGVLAARIAAVPSQLNCDAPLSPDDAKTVIPWAAAFRNTSFCCRRRPGSMQVSASPKLCEITSPTLLLTT